jgi:DNA helicase II / ATP-dependent DNA helicase PcrA
MAEFVPTPEQIEALSAPTPLLILAGAGTGKTTVVTHRIADLIASGDATPHEILALTFADKAATEMAERLGALMDQQGRGEAGMEVTCRTFHSLGADVVREYAPLLGMESDFRVLSTPEGWQLLSRVLDDLDFQAIELPMGGIGRLMNGLLGFFSQAKDHMVGPEDLDSFISREEKRLSALSAVAAEYWQARLAALRDVSVAYRAYEEAKRRHGYLDYGDLLLLPVKLFRAHPDVREVYRWRYRHLFVDEYQDTNYSQRTLLLELLSPEARVVVIGDDDQSIYGWRGAVIRNILDFPNEPVVKAAGANQRFLTVNRRSGPPILDIANAVVSQLDYRYPKKLSYMPDSVPATVGHYVAATDEAEGRWIADTIEKLHGTSEVTDPTGKKWGHGVFAVLCRKRSLFQPVARALAQRGIPYELVSGSGFYGRWEIRDALSYLRVLADPADNIALTRVLQSPSWRLSDRDLFHLSEWAQAQARHVRSDRTSLGQDPALLDTVGRGALPRRPDAPKDDAHAPQSPLSTDGLADDGGEITFRLTDAVTHHDDVPGLSPGAHSRLSRLKSLLDSLARAVSRVPLAQLVERTIEEAGYRRELTARPDFDSHLALLNLGKLVELARQFQDDSSSLDAFVEYVRYALESGGEEADVLAVDEASDAVKVMTVHQAKGLEFPVVFIPGLAERLFPDPRLDDPDRWDQFPEQLKAHNSVGATCIRPASLDLTAIADKKQLKAALDERKECLRAEALDEERRLFYVALTRAQRALFLSRARWYGANTRARVPSLFWDEVVATGLSEPLGEESDPGFNPKLQGSQPSGNGSGALRPESLARLILAPDHGASWIAQIASAHPEEWSRKRAEVEAAVSSFTQSHRLPLSPSPAPPVAVSCSGLIQYDRCPRLYRYCYVDRLPQRPAPWAAVGTEVHRLIEEMSRAQEHPPAGTEDEHDPDPDEREHPHHEGHAPGIQDLLAVYRGSPFSQRNATRVEEPFLLTLGGNALRGRMDRLDQLPDGSWHLADFKVSRYHGQLLRRQHLQMQLYALAAWRLWQVDPERLTCHLLFLIDGHQEALAFSPEELLSAESWASDQLRRIQTGHFPLVKEPESCAYCEYRHLC